MALLVFRGKPVGQFTDIRDTLIDKIKSIKIRVSFSVRLRKNIRLKQY